MPDTTTLVSTHRAELLASMGTCAVCHDRLLGGQTMLIECHQTPLGIVFVYRHELCPGGLNHPSRATSTYGTRRPS